MADIDYEDNFLSDMYAQSRSKQLDVFCEEYREYPPERLRGILDDLERGLFGKIASFLGPETSLRSLAANQVLGEMDSVEVAE